MNQSQSEPKRQMVSNEVMQMLDDLADQSANLADRTSQIEAVCMPDDKGRQEKPDRPVAVWPPMFAKMRSQMEQIRENMLRAKEILDRCEI